MNRNVLLAVPLLCSAASIAAAEQVNTSWIGGTNNNWHTPAAWSGGVVPNNTATTNFNVEVGGGMPGFFVADAAVDSLHVGSAGAVQMVMKKLRIEQSLAIDGRFEVGSSTFYGQLLLGPAATLTGSGSLVLSGGTFRRVDAPLEIPADLRITTSPAETLYQDIGGLDQPLINRGAIANQTGFISLNGSTFQNTGILTANGNGPNGGGGGLIFNFQNWRIEDVSTATRTNGGAFVVGGVLDNAGRTLNFDDSFGKWFIAGTIRGGTINVPADHVLSTPTYRSAAYDGVTLNGAFSADNDFTLVDGRLHGNGTVRITSPSGENARTIRSGTSTLVIENGMTVIAEGSARVSPFTADSGITANSIRIEGTARSQKVSSDSVPASEFEMTGDVVNAGRISTGLASAWVFGQSLSADAGVFEIALSQPTPATVPLQVAGNFNLAGARFEFIGGAAPAGTRFLIATAAGGISGTAVASSGFALDIVGGQLFAVVVPEPAAIASGLAAAIAVVRRRRGVR